MNLQPNLEKLPVGSFESGIWLLVLAMHTVSDAILAKII